MGVDDYTLNDDGAIIGCPKCKGRALRKDGYKYRATKPRKQLWRCYSCGTRTLNPFIIEPPKFTVDKKYKDARFMIERSIVYNPKD